MKIWDVRGEGMETDIPYKDTLFTVVSESFFMRRRTNRICFRKSNKTNITSNIHLLFYQQVELYLVT